VLCLSWYDNNSYIVFRLTHSTSKTGIGCSRLTFLPMFRTPLTRAMWLQQLMVMRRRCLAPWICCLPPDRRMLRLSLWCFKNNSMLSIMRSGWLNYLFSWLSFQLNTAFKVIDWAGIWFKISASPALVADSAMMSSLAVRCLWDDEMVREGTGHPPSGYDNEVANTSYPWQPWVWGIGSRNCVSSSSYFLNCL